MAGIDDTYLAMARRSASVKFAILTETSDILPPTKSPSGNMPNFNNSTNSVRDQFPIPLSKSGVIFGILFPFMVMYYYNGNLLLYILSSRCALNLLIIYIAVGWWLRYLDDDCDAIRNNYYYYRRMF